MRKMIRFQIAACALLLPAVALLSAGCRSDDNSNAVNSTANRAGVELNSNSAKPAQGNTAQATPAQASPTQATQTMTPGAAAPDAPPITDAAAFRDQLLALAQAVKFDVGASASANGDAIRAAWSRQYPNLKFSIFYSMAADASTVSSSDTFLISGAAGNFDQLYAFAVADAKGKCAGGAVVIPGDNANRKVSKEKIPTVFKSIDMSNSKSCTGETAGDQYKP
jgi:hypothetical protein